MISHRTKAGLKVVASLALSLEYTLFSDFSSSYFSLLSSGLLPHKLKL